MKQFLIFASITSFVIFIYSYFYRASLNPAPWYIAGNTAISGFFSLFFIVSFIVIKADEEEKQKQNKKFFK